MFRIFLMFVATISFMATFGAAFAAMAQRLVP